MSITSQSLILWDDVPNTMRVTEKDLRQCIGGRDEQWIRRHLDDGRESRCQAAVPFHEHPLKYVRCSRSKGYKSLLCWQHFIISQGKAWR
jgi:hypothetical protein